MIETKESKLKKDETAPDEKDPGNVQQTKDHELEAP